MVYRTAVAVGDRWGERTLQDEHWDRVDLGPLSIVVLRRHEEWRIAVLDDR